MKISAVSSCALVVGAVALIGCGSSAIEHPMHPAAVPSLTPSPTTAKIIIVHPDRTGRALPFGIFNQKTMDTYGLAYQNSVFSFEVPAGPIDLCAAADGTGAMTTGTVEAGRTYVFRLDMAPNFTTSGAILIPMKPKSEDWEDLKADLPSIRGSALDGEVKKDAIAVANAAECKKQRDELDAEERAAQTFTIDDAVAGK